MGQVKNLKFVSTITHCINCGEALEGDGYTTVLHCPNAEDTYSEPDGPAVMCDFKE